MAVATASSSRPRRSGRGSNVAASQHLATPAETASEVSPQSSTNNTRSSSRFRDTPPSDDTDLTEEDDEDEYEDSSRGKAAKSKAKASTSSAPTSTAIGKRKRSAAASSGRASTSSSAAATPARSVRVKREVKVEADDEDEISMDWQDETDEDDENGRKPFATSNGKKLTLAAAPASRSRRGRPVATQRKAAIRSARQIKQQTSEDLSDLDHDELDQLPKKAEADDDDDDEIEDSLPLSRPSLKGKGKAKEEPKSINLADYAFSDEDVEDVATLSSSRRQRQRAQPRNNKKKAKQESDWETSDEEFNADAASGSEEEYDSEDDDDFVPRRREKTSKGAAIKADNDDDTAMEDLSSDSDANDSGDDTVEAGPSNSNLGANGEELQYETAKQRAARIKSENYKRRLKKKPAKTHYQKTVDALGKYHPELKTVWKKLHKSQTGAKKEAAEQPEGLNIKLLPFQLEGVHWLVNQEKAEWKGGILADEMGMGKTIQMISLFLSDRKTSPGPTLVVAPTVAILQWRNEIAKYTQDFKVLVWHGASREVNPKKMSQYDVILTSYAVMESSFRKQEVGFKRKGELLKEKSALHNIHWHRIVLDEAHNIKERATNTAKAAFELKGNYRWCLSGTPLQNRVGELYSMIRFLGGDPYAYYYCKRCPCKSLHWQFSDRRSCDKCGHTPMHHACLWNIAILKPIQNHGTHTGEGRKAFKRLRALLERIMLRRTKVERVDDMGLPPRTITVRKDYFNEEEEDLYDSLYRDGARKFSTFIDSGTVLNNYSNIFTLLTRMRQMACHPDLVLRSKTGIAQKLLGDTAPQNTHICRICAEEASEPIASKCRHVFCRECARQYLEGAAEILSPDCPHCHAPFAIDLEQEVLETHQSNETRAGILSKIDVDKWRSSTKIEALVEELNSVRRDDSTIKSLVFSQFVNFLDLVAFRLQRAGFKICRLEGHMTPEARDRTVRYFMETPDVTVFLVSLKAGGVALNLTEASRVYLLDPWWNPSVELQGFDRIHRLGQHRPVKITRMIIENSIESRIVELQQKKSAMINAALSKDDGAANKLAIADLKYLFQL